MDIFDNNSHSTLTIENLDSKINLLRTEVKNILSYNIVFYVTNRNDMIYF